MSTSFTFRADADLTSTIRTQAAAFSKPVSVLIRDAIRAGLDEQSSRSADIIGIHPIEKTEARDE